MSPTLRSDATPNPSPGAQLYCARSRTALPPLNRLEDVRRGQRRGGGWQVARDGLPLTLTLTLTLILTPTLNAP